MHKIFSDYFAQKNNFLTRIDARIKIFFVTAAIALLVCSKTLLVPALLLLLVVASLLASGAPLVVILLRLLVPLGVGLTLCMLKILTQGTTLLFQWNFWGWCLGGYWEGLEAGFFMLIKILGATSLVLFLSLSTTLRKILAAASWCGINKTWIEIALLTYRYIFVLLEEALKVLDAQRARLGYINLSKSLRSMGQFAGVVVVKAYDQSISTYQAMVLRGYNGEGSGVWTCPPVYRSRLKLKPADILAALVFLVILILLFIINFR